MVCGAHTRLTEAVTAAPLAPSRHGGGAVRRTPKPVTPHLGQHIPDAYLDALHAIAAAAAPRRRVRVDATGTHTYATHIPFGPTAPTVPWAVELADGTEYLRLLAIDFDDTNGARPDLDADNFVDVLEGIGCPAILAQSSPESLRRHVWVWLAEPWRPTRTAAFIRLLAAHYPTADLTALANPATGCVRFPGSPHRGGGTSTILSISLPPNCDAVAALVGSARAPEDLDHRIAIMLTGRDRPTHTRGWRITDPDQIRDETLTAAALLRQHGGLAYDPAPDTGLPPIPAAAHNLRPTLGLLTVGQPGDITALSLAADAAVTALWRRRLTRPVLPDPATRTSIPTPHRAAITPPAAADSSRDTAATGDRTPAANTPVAPVPAAVANAGFASLLSVLPAAVQQLLLPSRTPLAADLDASAVQWTTLIACRRAGWSEQQVLDYDRRFTPPAFTHAHSRRHPSGTRVPRSSRATAKSLAKDYARTVDRAHITPDDVDIDGVRDLAHQILDWADRCPALAFTVDTRILRCVLEAHLTVMLRSNRATYSVSTRELAWLAGVRSPQTALHYTRVLAGLGLLELTQPGEGTRAHTYRILGAPTHTHPNPPTHTAVPPLTCTWTQGGHAPRTTVWGEISGVLQNVEFAELLAQRTTHFRHDVWCAASVGEHAAVVAFWVAHHGIRDVDSLARHCAITADEVRESLSALHDLGLLDTDLTPTLSAHTYQEAAHRTGTAGVWDRRKFGWDMQALRWQWWCAETDLLTATNGSPEHIAARATLNEFGGRYPRYRHTGEPHHTRALTILTAANHRTQWEAQ